MSNVKQFQMPDGTLIQVKDETARSSITSLQNILNAMDDTLDTITRPTSILCIGDSYLRGSQNSNPTTENWGNYVRENLGLFAGSSYFAFGGSGAGFTRSSDYNLYYQFQLAHAQLSATQKNSITHIIIGAGANDHNDDASHLELLSQSFSDIASMIASDYQRDVKVMVVAIGWNAQYELRKNLPNMYRNYAKQCSKYGFRYFECYQVLQNTTYFNSDGVHPNPSGQTAIAENITNFVLGGMVMDNHGLKWNMRIGNTVVGHAYYAGNAVYLKFLDVDIPLSNANNIFTNYVTAGVISSPVLLGALSSGNVTFVLPCVINNSDTSGRVCCDADVWLYKSSETAAIDDIKIDVRCRDYGFTGTLPDTVSTIRFRANIVAIPLPLA